MAIKFDMSIIPKKMAKLFGSVSAELSMLVGFIITLISIPKPETDNGILPFWVLQWLLIIAIFVIFAYLCLKFILLGYKDLVIYYNNAKKCIILKINENNKTPANKVRNAVKTINKEFPKIEKEKLIQGQESKNF